MTITPNIEQLQRVLLTTAAKVEGGQLLPAPKEMANFDIAIREAIGALIDSGLADEIIVDAPQFSWRIDDDQMYGAVINAAGRIKIDEDGAAKASPSKRRQHRKPCPAEIENKPTATARPPAKKKPGGKADQVIALLKRRQGASLAEIMELTGWLAHSTRAAMSGLRKKGHAIERTQAEGSSVYRIGKAVR